MKPFNFFIGVASYIARYSGTLYRLFGDEKYYDVIRTIIYKFGCHW